MKSDDQVVPQNYTQVISHTHLKLHIYFNCCFLELVSLESHLGAEMHETSSALKFDTVGSI